jgi:hypothetical protein
MGMKKKYTGLIILMVICHILPWAALVGGVAVVNHIAKTGDLTKAYYGFSDSIMDAISNPPDFEYTKTAYGDYIITGIVKKDFDRKSGKVVELIYISFRVPSKYEGKPVVSVGGLGNQEKLEIVSLPNSIANINTAAFVGCKSLKEINFPRSLIGIGENAFRNCGLTEVNLSGSISTIGSNAFADCSNLETVSINGNKVSINYEAFTDCKALKKVVLGKGVKSIGEGAFKGCSKLRTVTMTNDVKSIGNEAFWGCIQLERINFLGTAEEWEAIDKGENWVSSISFSVYCSDGTVIEY